MNGQHSVEICSEFIVMAHSYISLTAAIVIFRFTHHSSYCHERFSAPIQILVSELQGTIVDTHRAPQADQDGQKKQSASGRRAS